MSKPLHRVAGGAHVALLFVLSGILYFAVPRALIAAARSFEPAKRSVPSLTRAVHVRVAMLDALSKLPGHEKKADYATYRLLRKTGDALFTRALRSSDKRHQLAASVFALLAGREGRHRWLGSSLARLGALERLAHLGLFSKRSPRAPVSAAVALGQSHHAGALLSAEIERALARDVKLFDRRLLGRLVATGDTLGAYELTRRAAEHAKSSDRDELRSLQCTLGVVTGRGNLAPSALGKQRRRCAAAKLYALLIEPTEQKKLLAARDALRSASRFGLHKYDLLELTTLAQLGLWHEAVAHARRARGRFGARRNLYQIFNSIYTSPRPLPLVQRLIRALSEKLVRDGASSPLAADLRDMLGRALLERCSRHLLSGAPRRALADIARALPLLRQPRHALRLQVELTELIDGAKAALALLDRQRRAYRARHGLELSRPLLAATLAAAAGDNKRLLAQMPLVAKARGCRYQSAICELLRVEAAIVSGKLDDVRDLRSAAKRMKPFSADSTKPAVIRLAWHLDKKKMTPLARRRALRDVYLSNASSRMRSQLLLARLVDRSGAMLASVIPKWMTALSYASVPGDLLGTYLLERLARARADKTEAARLVARRRRLGAMYRNAALTFPRRLTD